MTNQEIRSLEAEVEQLEKDKSFDAALTCCNKLLLLKPLDKQYFFKKVIVLARLDRVDEAIKKFDEAIAKTHLDTEYYLLKIQYLALVRKKDAPDYVKKVIDIFPDNLEVYHKGIYILTDLGRYQEALDWCDKALSKNQKYVNVLLGKLNIFEKLGQVEKEQEYLREIEEMNRKEELDFSGSIFKKNMLSFFFQNKRMMVNDKKTPENQPNKPYLTNTLILVFFIISLPLIYCIQTFLKKSISDSSEL